MSAVREEEYTGPAFTAQDKQYVGVALGLGVITAVEVGFYYLLKDGHIGTALNVWALLAMAFVKFVVVAAYFMHLKFDSPMFRRLFAGGAVLAGFCYIAVLSLFGVMRGSIHWFAYVGFAVIVGILVLRSTKSTGHGH
jgi:cytochrome c oxidase subunit IV